jgi:hypothetical protein
VVEEAARKPSRSRRVRAARYLQPPPSMTSGSEGPVDPADAGIPADAADRSCDGPIVAPDPPRDEQPQDPLPAVDPAEIDVSDWEVAA